MTEPKQLKAKDVPAERQRLMQLQGGICLLCARPIQSPCLDHDHTTGRVRAVCCSLCNTTEGQIKKTLIRSGLVNALGQDGALLFLENLIAYYRKDYSNNNLHPNHVKDELKRFSRLNKSDQQAYMQRLGLDDTGTKQILESRLKKYLQK